MADADELNKLPQIRPTGNINISSLIFLKTAKWTKFDDQLMYICFYRYVDYLYMFWIIAKILYVSVKSYGGKSLVHC